MPRLVTLYSLVLVLSVVPSGFAGPACARRHYRSADCVERCKARWGWTGNMMGTNRWGSVIQKVDQSADIWDAIIAEACGLSIHNIVSSAPSATISMPSSPTLSAQPGPVIGAGSDPAESTPLSSSSLVFSSVVISLASPSVISTSLTPSVKLTNPTVTNTPHTAPTTPTTRFATSVLPSSSVSQKPVTTKSLATSKPPLPATTPSSDTSTSSGSGSTSGDVQAYLSAHNNFRTSHGASPLAWSDELASKAQKWASGCQFQHSGGSLGPYGENLAAGTGTSYGISQAIKSWTDESSDYNANNPQPSHFTQVVWKGSQQLGCAVQECSGIFPAQYGTAKFYVCEYFPAGNVIGDFVTNVQA